MLARGLKWTDPYVQDRSLTEVEAKFGVAAGRSLDASAPAVV